MKHLTLRNTLALALALLFVVSNAGRAAAQPGEEKVKLTREAKIAREQSIAMLNEMEEILNEYYYDAKFHGIDVKSRVETAKTRVKTMQYNWQMYRVLVQLLMDFNDSHTTMIMPPRTDYFQYGFGMQMVADSCYVTSVKKDSDAHKQGVEVGDEIIALGKFKPNRRDLWKMLYVIYKLDPADTLDLKIRKPDGSEKTMTVKAKTMTRKEFRAEQKARKDKQKFEPFKCQELAPSLVACKLYSFSVEKNDIDKMMTVALKYPKMILDLRGNGGGYVVVEEYLLSHFFDREVKIADVVTRKKTEARVTKPVGNRRYNGELAVLVDANSASASEMTARVLQLEKRAKIYGDFTSGSVMTSITLPFRSLMSALSDAAVIRAGMSVTVADVIMRDGSRLEKTGVEPDELLQPNGLAFANRLDPALAYVAQQFGASVTPEQAGGYYFMVPKEESDDEASDDDN